MLKKRDFDILNELFRGLASGTNESEHVLFTKLC